MANFSICVELNDKQQKQFDEWCSHIEALYGDCGLMTWTITPTGIGSGITVYNKRANVTLDLTDVESW